MSKCSLLLETAEQDLSAKAGAIRKIRNQVQAIDFAIAAAKSRLCYQKQFVFWRSKALNSPCRVWEAKIPHW